IWRHDNFHYYERNDSHRHARRGYLRCGVKESDLEGTSHQDSRLWQRPGQGQQEHKQGGGKIVQEVSASAKEISLRRRAGKPDNLRECRPEAGDYLRLSKVRMAVECLWTAGLDCGDMKC